MNIISRIFNLWSRRRALRGSAEFILEEFAKTVNAVVAEEKQSDRIKSDLFKEVLKFEALAYVLWLFQGTDIFPENMHKLLLDEIHNQYFSRLRKHGYNTAQVQIVCDEFTVRYKAYGEIFKPNKNLAGVGSRFVRFLAEKSKTAPSLLDMNIPVQLAMKVKPQFDMFREMQNAS